MEHFSRLIGVRATRLALSIHEMPDVPDRKLFVCPPLLREQMAVLDPRPAGQFSLIYLLTHGYAEQIIRWSDAHPQTRLHCFYDKPDAPPEWDHSSALTFHRLDGGKFLRMMADCSHVVSTAGFELVAEAGLVFRCAVQVGAHSFTAARGWGTGRGRVPRSARG